MPRPTVVPGGVRKQIVELARAGRAPAELAREFGWAQPQVYVAVAGLGMTLLPEDELASQVSAGTLLYFLEADAHPSPTITLYYPAAKQPSSALGRVLPRSAPGRRRFAKRRGSRRQFTKILVATLRGPPGPIGRKRNELAPRPAGN
jgi:DNA-binding transcriptional LysR family regulator